MSLELAAGCLLATRLGCVARPAGGAGGAGGLQRLHRRPLAHLVDMGDVVLHQLHARAETLLHLLNSGLNALLPLLQRGTAAFLPGRRQAADAQQTETGAARIA